MALFVEMTGDVSALVENADDHHVTGWLCNIEYKMMLHRQPTIPRAKPLHFPTQIWVVNQQIKPIKQIVCVPIGPLSRPSAHCILPDIVEVCFCRGGEAKDTHRKCFSRIRRLNSALSRTRASPLFSPSISALRSHSSFR